MARLKSNLDLLMKRWEKDHKIPLSKAALATATGISRDTINRMYKDDVNRFDKHTVTELCKFFKCDVGDLLTIQYEPGEFVG